METYKVFYVANIKDSQFDPDVILDIRVAKKRGVLNSVLAQRYEKSESTIWRIVNNETWTWLKERHRGWWKNPPTEPISLGAKEKAEMRRLHQEGIPIGWIARLYGVCSDTVYRKVRRI